MTETMRDTFVATVGRLLDTDSRAVVVLADIGVSRFGAGGAALPERMINVGIREQLMIGVAAGLALEGFRPIVHSYAPFLVERPFEQIKLDLGHQGLGAILVSIGGSFDAAEEGRTHQSPADVALLSTLPGFTIHAPGHPAEVEAMLQAAMAGSGPVYIRLSERVNRMSTAVDGAVHPVRRGEAGAPTVLAVGPTLDLVLDAVDGLPATVLHTVTVAPFDGQGLRGSMSGRDVVVVEPYLRGTTARWVGEALSDRPHRITSIGVGSEEYRRYGSRLDHERHHGLDPASIRRVIETMTAPTDH
jgi:transketolase